MKYIYLSGNKNKEKEIIVFSGKSNDLDLSNQMQSLNYSLLYKEQFLEKHQLFPSSERVEQSKEDLIVRAKEVIKKGKNVIILEKDKDHKHIGNIVVYAKQNDYSLNIMNSGNSNLFERKMNVFEQRLGNENHRFINGEDEVYQVVSQENIKIGKQIPKMLIKDSLELLELSVSMMANKWLNSKPETQLNMILSTDLMSLKEISTSLKNGNVKYALLRQKEASEKVKNNLLPKEFFKVLNNKNFKKEIENVLREYSVDNKKGAELDIDLSRNLYKEHYGLSIDNKVTESLKNKERRKLKM